MTDIASAYLAYKGTNDEILRKENRLKIFNLLALEIVNSGLKGQDLSVYIKTLREKLHEVKVKEINELNNAFDTIIKILF
jgi:hypothetical protein